MSAGPGDPSEKVERLLAPGESSASVTQPRANPNATWVCGYAELGQCCRSGPNRDGRCGLSLAVADNDNPDLRPCIPRRTGLGRSQSLRMNLAILTGGLLLLVMTLPSREKSFVPGELSAGHAQIMATTLVSQRCGLCHPNTHSDDPTTATSTNFAIGALTDTARRLIANDGRQDTLCMQCHKSHMPHAAMRSPHDLSSDDWRTWLAERQTGPAGKLVSNTPATNESRLPESMEIQTSCALCHNEHHGRNFDITLMADDRCQACHQRRFESLVSGHPEFSNFPIQRPRALAFSHDAHANKHFGKKNEVFDCRACHLDVDQTNRLGPITRSVSFEKACARCHTEPIRAATVDGWAVLQLPSIEPRVATEAHGMQHWPQSARYGFDGVVSPVLRALLAADDEVAEALTQLPPTDKLADLSTVDDQREKITLKLAAAVERLIRDTANHGQAAWQSRLEKVTQSRLRRELTLSERNIIAVMSRGGAPDLFRAIEQRWFQASVPLASEPANNAIPSGRLVVQPQAASAKTSSALQAPATSKKSPGSTAQSNDDSLLEQTSDTLGQASDALDGSLDDSLLKAETETESSDALLGGPPTSKSGQASKVVAVRGATHVAAGGWYLNDATLSLSYMPTGHADETLSAWCLWWSLIESADRAQATPTSSNLPLLVNRTERLDPSRKIPGGCAECHQLQSQSFAACLSTSFADGWRIDRQSQTRKEFTRFNHAPHLTLPAVNDCRYCHKSIQTPPATAAEHASLASRLVTVHSAEQPALSPSAWHQHGRDFESMTVSQCTACHRPGGASDRCTKCHNYHVSGMPADRSTETSTTASVKR